jgi:hypothetical protein
MDLSKIESIIRKNLPNAQDGEIELYLDSVSRDLKRGDEEQYSDYSEEDFVEDFENYIADKSADAFDLDEVSKPSMKMKKSELKEMIKSAMISEMGSDAQYADENAYDFVDEAEEDLDEILARISEEEIEEGDDKVVDPYLAEAEEDEEVDVKVDVDDLEDEVDVDVDVDAKEEVPTKNDAIVVDKKIVSLSSLPGDTRKILDSLETLRAQAEEFGDQKFITQVGNTITFFTRDFVVAGDQPNPAGIEESKESLNESVTFPMWNKIK